MGEIAKAVKTLRESIEKSPKGITRRSPRSVLKLCDRKQRSETFINELREALENAKVYLQGEWNDFRDGDVDTNYTFAAEPYSPATNLLFSGNQGEKQLCSLLQHFWEANKIAYFREEHIQLEEREAPLGNHKVDFLGSNVHKPITYVIEVKAKCDDAVVAQTVRYVEEMRGLLAKERRPGEVKGIIIGPFDATIVRLARAQGLEVLSYDLSFDLRPIEQTKS